LFLLHWTCLVRGNPETGNIMSHHKSPSEVDVASQSCDYDSRTGFAGDIGEDHYSVDYYYVLLADSTLLGNTEIISTERINVGSSLLDNSIHSVIFQIELGIGSYLLRESGEFYSAPCNMRQLFPSTEGVRNVGLTLGPDDAIVATCESEDPTVSCYWVAGSFQVYTLGKSGNTTINQQNIHKDLEKAMNGGSLNNVHRAILNITYMEGLPSNMVDGVTASGQTDTNAGNNTDTVSSETDSSNGPENAAIIVSSSVGGVLLVTAIALANRKRIRLDESTMFQANSMDVSEFQTSQAASAVGSSVV
jgi:hypothetical protein